MGLLGVQGSPLDHRRGVKVLGEEEGCLEAAFIFEKKKKKFIFMGSFNFSFFLKGRLKRHLRVGVKCADVSCHAYR